MANTIKTNLHFFYLDTSKADQAAIFNETVLPAMKATGFPIDRVSMMFRTANPEGWKFLDKLMGAVGHVVNTHDLRVAQVELEMQHLFANQWNSAPMGEFETGARLWNAVEYVFENMSIKCGYWLDQTPEMREILRNTHKCGYCGKQEPAAKGYTFCPHCISSEYLTRKDLHLTRMLPVCDTGNRAPLTDAESAHLLPIFKEAQLRGNTERDKARIAKQRSDVHAEYEKVTRNATTKRDGFIALMDLGLKTDNVIFYEHKGVFSFGWRNPVDSEIVSDILEVISEFPFPYEIKCADGRMLSGNIG